MKKMIVIMIAVLIGGSAMAAFYYEDFSVVSNQTEFGAINFGGTNGNAILDYNRYVLAGENAAIVDQGGGNFALRPNLDGKANARLAMVVIDTTTWSAGTYTLSFDFIGADAGGSRLYVGTANGYDLTGTDNDAIELDGFANGFSDTSQYGINAVGNATVADLINIDLDGIGGANETVSRAISTNFTLTGSTDALVLGFGSYGSSFMVDKVSVVPEPATISMIGLGGLLALLTRRLRA